MAQLLERLTVGFLLPDVRGTSGAIMWKGWMWMWASMTENIESP